MLNKPSLANEMIQYLGNQGDMQSCIDSINLSGVRESEKNQLIDIFQRQVKKSTQKMESFKIIKYDVKVHIMDLIENDRVVEVVPCRKNVIQKSMLYFQSHIQELKI